MNKEIKLLHDTAMDFHDMSNMAKIKGDKMRQDSYLQIAYILEKEAALRYYTSEKDTLWRFFLLRSAGWLAYYCGAIEDAKNLADMGLKSGATDIVKAELEELKEKINYKIEEKTSKETIINSNPNQLQFYGTLASADVDTKVIKIREGVDETYHSIFVPVPLIHDVAKAYFGKAVKVQAKKNDKGTIVLEDIQLAA